MAQHNNDYSHDGVHRDRIVAAEENWRRHDWHAGPAFLAAVSILRVEQLIRESNTDALSPHGLTHSRHEALALIYFSKNHEMALTKLSQRLMVHPTSVTSTVDSLERLGLVERIRHPQDRRTTLARATEKGRSAIEESSKAMGEASYALGALNDKEAMEIFRLLAKVRASAGDTVEPAHQLQSPGRRRL